MSKRETVHITFPPKKGPFSRASSSENAAWSPPGPSRSTESKSSTHRGHTVEALGPRRSRRTAGDFHFQRSTVVLFFLSFQSPQPVLYFSNHTVLTPACLPTCEANLTTKLVANRPHIGQVTGSFSSLFFLLINPSFLSPRTLPQTWRWRRSSWRNSQCRLLRVWFSDGQSPVGTT